MKIRKVSANNHKRAFEVVTHRVTYSFPYAKLELKPSVKNPIVEVYVDPELAREAFTYVLQSGDEDSVHVEQVLDYNKDPVYLRDMLLYRLTLEAQKRVENSGLSKRELIRRLATSPTQLYRLLDQTNYRKSIDQMLRLLQVLGCDVDLVVKDRRRKAG